MRLNLVTRGFVIIGAVFSFWCLFGRPLPAYSRTFFLSPRGSDANVGSKARPWRTITHAAAKMKPGDVTYLRGGTYTGNFEIRKSGTARQPLKFIAYPGEKPLLVGPAIEKGEDKDTLRVYGSYVIVDKLRITNRNDPGQGVWIAHKAHHVTISNSEIFGARGQGVLISGNYNTLYRNRIHHNGSHGTHDHGIYIEGGNNRIRGNTIYNNWAYGIHLYREDGDSGNNVIESNYVYGNGFGASKLSGRPPTAGIIIAAGHPNTIIRNNRVCNNARYGIYLIDEQPGAVIERNVTCRNAGGGIYLRYPGATYTVARNFSYSDSGFALATPERIEISK